MLEFRERVNDKTPVTEYRFRGRSIARLVSPAALRAAELRTLTLSLRKGSYIIIYMWVTFYAVGSDVM